MNVVNQINSTTLKVIPQGPSGVLVELPSIARAGSFNEVTVDAQGRVVSGVAKTYLTQAQVQAIHDKINEMLSVMFR